MRSWLRLSSELVASSKSRTRGLATRARAIWALSLAAGERRAVFAQHGVQTHRHGADFVFEVSQTCGPPGGVVAEVYVAADDVEVETGWEGFAVLQDDTELAAQRLHVELPQVVAVVEHRTRVWLLETEQHVQARRFAAARHAGHAR